MSAIGNSEAIETVGYGSLAAVEEPSSTAPLINRIAQVVFQAASYLTDPICKVHEYYRRLAVVDPLNPTASISNLIRKVALCVGIMGWASLAVVTTLPGIGLRALGS